MQRASHRIRRQKWLVHTGSAEEAFAWRKLLRDKGQDILLPVLEKAFDEVARDERVICIPRIELKVKIDSEKHVSEVLFNQIIQQLREQLQHLLHEHAQSTRQHLIGKESTTQKDWFETLLYYLRTGSVPWQAANDSGHEIAGTLTDICREEWPQLLDYAVKNYESASFFFRLLQLVSKEQFGSLMSVLSDRIPQGVRPAVIQCITGLFHSAKTILSRYTRIRIIASILSDSLRWQENTIVSDLFSVAVDAIPPEEKHVFFDFILSLPAAAAALFQQEKPDRSRDEHDASVVLGTKGNVLPDFISTLPADTAALFQQEKPDRSRDEHDASVVLGTKGNVMPDFLCSLDIGKGQTNTGRVNSGIFGKKAGQSYPPIVPDYPIQNKPEEDVFPFLVHQAGLVLIHPFIARFFENTGIIKTGDMQLSSFSLARAAALLHFLATCREEVYEYELGFIKIFLGMCPESPLPVCEGLVKSCDKEESESLLQAVIGHWSVLKNTSVSGLRSSFLQRPALLREDENGWNLHVERVPFDVLLDQLPWSISIVKLPWMKKALYTEW